MSKCIEMWEEYVEQLTCSQWSKWHNTILGRSTVGFRAIGLMSRMFANGLGDFSSIPGRVIPKTQKKKKKKKKMVLDTSWLNTQNYKVRIKGKVEQSKEWVVPPPSVQ